MTKLVDIQGIGAAFADKLKSAGVATQEQLLENGATKVGRQKLAEAAGVAEKLVLGWVNRADLARIKGVGEQFADLLEQAGVDTVVELAQRNAVNLHTKMSEINEVKKLVRSLPAAGMVEGWVDQAKKLGRVVHH